MPTATLLVVDDNPTNLKLACYVLKSEGYSVLQASNAQEAQAVLQHTVPDLILMDIQMPGMDGLSLTRIIKANPAYSGICIVALTSFAMKGDAEKARAAGCGGYITKPIDTTRLPLQIAELLRAAAAGSPENIPLP